ncbi:hypothetical protein CLCR_05239 [Cladophialophora carrionii]|uniref:Uncharacterized protein n=1 Tax=Cladophialophora carrionii TaxID=86049 RepID=A0A1C1CLL2_9EURO|nr:hypothetical protein CLCR_05239 [Cladophialophora carrionii]
MAASQRPRKMPNIVFERPEIIRVNTVGPEHADNLGPYFAREKDFKQGVPYVQGAAGPFLHINEQGSHRKSSAFGMMSKAQTSRAALFPSQQQAQGQTYDQF